MYGKAPAAMEALPVPTHAFIGGSSGQLKEILALLLEKNPKIHIVVNAITLETVAEMTRCCRELPLKDFAATLVQTARSRAVGSSHLMTGGNPVYIMSCQGDAKDGWQAEKLPLPEKTPVSFAGGGVSLDPENGNEIWCTDGQDWGQESSYGTVETQSWTQESSYGVVEEQIWVDDVSESSQEQSWNHGMSEGENR